MKIKYVKNDLFGQITRLFSLMILLALTWIGCDLSSGGGGDGGGGGGGGNGGGGGISKQPITSITGTIQGYVDSSTGQSVSYDFNNTGKSVFFGFNGMPPNTYSAFKRDSASFNISLSSGSLDLMPGDTVFGAGLSYSNTSARFVEGFVVVISREPFPDSILYDRHELNLMKSNSTSTGFEYLIYIYSSLPTTVTGTDTGGDSFDLDLDTGWNRVLVRFNYSTQKSTYTSEAEPSGLQWIAILQPGQILLAGSPTKTIDGNDDYSFAGKRIVLEYGEDTKLYTPAGQGNFTYATPIPSSSHLGSAPEVFGTGISIQSGPSDALFSRIRLRIYNNNQPTDDEVFFGKQSVDENTTTFLTYFYSSKNGVTITGNHDPGNGPIETFNVTLSEGWNKVKGVFDMDTQQIEFVNYALGDETGMDWGVYSPAD